MCSFFAGTSFQEARDGRPKPIEVSLGLVNACCNVLKWVGECCEDCREGDRGGCAAHGGTITHTELARQYSTLMGTSCRGQGAQMQLELLSAVVGVLVGVRETMGTSRGSCSIEQSCVSWVLTYFSCVCSCCCCFHFATVTLLTHCLAPACLVKARSRNSDLMWTQIDMLHLGVAAVPTS